MKKVELTGSRNFSIQIDEDDVLKAAAAIVRREFGIKDYFLKGNEVRVDDDHYHGSVTDSLVRKATAEDKAVFVCLEMLLQTEAKVRA